MTTNYDNLPSDVKEAIGLVLYAAQHPADALEDIPRFQEAAEKVREWLKQPDTSFQLGLIAGVALAKKHADVRKSLTEDDDWVVGWKDVDSEVAKLS